MTTETLAVIERLVALEARESARDEKLDALETRIVQIETRQAEGFKEISKQLRIQHRQLMGVVNQHNLCVEKLLDRVTAPLQSTVVQILLALTLFMAVAGGLGFGAWSVGWGDWSLVVGEDRNKTEGTARPERATPEDGGGAGLAQPGHNN